MKKGVAQPGRRTTVDLYAKFYAIVLANGFG
jgi:hypothetical protein